MSPVGSSLLQEEMNLKVLHHLEHSEHHWDSVKAGRHEHEGDCRYDGLLAGGFTCIHRVDHSVQSSCSMLLHAIAARRSRIDRVTSVVIAARRSYLIVGSPRKCI